MKADGKKIPVVASLADWVTPKMSERVKAAIEARRLGRSLPCDAPDEVIRRLLELADMRENSHTIRHRQGASEEAGGKPMEELNRIVKL